MILIYSIISNIYISFLIIGFGVTNKSKKISVKYLQAIRGLSRIIFLIVLIYLGWVYNIYLNLEGAEITYLDGLCKINKLILLNEMYLVILVLIILFIVGKDSTIQISKTPECILMIIINMISLIHLLCSNDFIVTIVSWELMNLTLYLLITMQSENGNENRLATGIKYFLLSALTTGFMLLGISLVYLETGSVNKEILITSLNLLKIPTYDLDILKSSLIGLILLTVTIMFKLGVIPFHYWVADLYDSLPNSILMYVMVIPKFCILNFLYLIIPILHHKIILNFIFFVAILSLLGGSIALNFQWTIKRFITYSGIVNLGYMLIAYVNEFWNIYFLYLQIYSVTTMIVLLILQSVNISNKGNNVEIKSIDELYGIFRNNRIIGMGFTLILLSLSGIPPLIGFYLKFGVISAIVSAYSTWTNITIVITTVISTLNYLLLIINFNYNLNVFGYKNNLNLKTEIINKKKNPIKKMRMYILVTFYEYFKPIIDEIKKYGKNLYIEHKKKDKFSFKEFFNDIYKIYKDSEFKSKIFPIYLNNPNIPNITINVSLINCLIIGSLINITIYLNFKFNVLSSITNSL